MSWPKDGSLRLGQLFLSKPGAFLSRDLSMLSTARLLAGSKAKALKGMAKSLSPMPRKPPKESTA